MSQVPANAVQAILGVPLTVIPQTPQRGIVQSVPIIPPVGAVEALVRAVMVDSDVLAASQNGGTFALYSSPDGVTLGLRVGSCSWNAGSHSKAKGGSAAAPPGFGIKLGAPLSPYYIAEMDIVTPSVTAKLSAGLQVTFS